MKVVWLQISSYKISLSPRGEISSVSQSGDGIIPQHIKNHAAWKINIKKKKTTHAYKATTTTKYQQIFDNKEKQHFLSKIKTKTAGELLSIGSCPTGLGETNRFALGKIFPLLLSSS